MLPDKVHVKKPERDVLPEAAKQDLERRMQRNAKKKQKKLKKRQAKSALRIDLDPSASTGTTCLASSHALLDTASPSARRATCACV
jgi:hypothetical protein